jgi:hypothetical protein
MRRRRKCVKELFLHLIGLGMKNFITFSKVWWRLMVYLKELRCEENAHTSYLFDWCIRFCP